MNKIEIVNENVNAEDQDVYIVSEKTLLAKAYALLKTKTNLYKEMTDIAENCGILNKSILFQLKDYQHYRGIGWDGDNPIAKSKEKEKYPDRVSPCFRRLTEIVYNLKVSNQLELLDEYLFAMKEIYGIEIKIDKKHSFGIPENKVDLKEVEKVVNKLDYNQGKICVIANEIRDDFSLNAESIGLCLKKSFKDFLKLYAGKVEQKKNISKFQQKIVDERNFDLQSVDKVCEITEEKLG